MQLCPRKWGPVWWSTRQQKWVGMHYITGFEILTVDLLKVNFRWPMTHMGVETLKMLETAILSQFNLIEDRKSVFSSQILSLLRSQSCGLRGDRRGGILFVIKVLPRPCWFALSFMAEGCKSLVQAFSTCVDQFSSVMSSSSSIL